MSNGGYCLQHKTSFKFCNMKKLFVLFAFSLLSIGSASAQDASISYATFKSPTGNYIEVYLHVAGQTVAFVPVTDSTVQAVLNVVILFKQGEQIVKFDKYRLKSPYFSQPDDFVDLKRYPLENGDYQVEVSVEDANQEGNAKTYSADFTVDFSETELCLSDIQLLASCKPVEPDSDNPMVKSGFCFEPLPHSFYGKSFSTLVFYNEIYNTDQAIGEDYMVSYFIDNADTKQKIESFGTGHKRKSAEPITPFLAQIDISALPSGNYNLIVEVRDRNRQLLGTKSTFFQRSNPFLQASKEEISSSGGVVLENEFIGKLSEAELTYSLKAIAMQVDKQDGVQINLLVKEKNYDAMRLYLFSYWAKENPNNPQGAYEAYMDVARKVDEKFQSGFRHGFETDRGYVFMKYGAPNDLVTMETEPSAPPYEIWFYNHFPQTGQNNVKFLFYNPNLVTNGHVLLHSTARGEINNPRWEVELYRNAPTEMDGNNFIDSPRMKDNTGRHARRLFESF